MVQLNHIGLYVSDLEGAKRFFEKYFGAKSGEKYHNPHKSFSSYLLFFDAGATLEIMTKPNLVTPTGRTNNFGYAHISIAVGSKEKVDETTKRMVVDGFRCIDGPRTTGDGYYESTVLDAEGNAIEITV